ncbi:hypothetical protein Z043_101320, partial [Scleropages formosus]
MILPSQLLLLHQPPLSTFESAVPANTNLLSQMLLNTTPDFPAFRLRQRDKDKSSQEKTAIAVAGRDTYSDVHMAVRDFLEVCVVFSLSLVLSQGLIHERIQGPLFHTFDLGGSRRAAGVGFGEVARSNLEEEVDKLRVQSAVDRASLIELRLCLQQKEQELAHRVAEDAEVKSGAPAEASAQRLERALKKMAQLERKLRSLDKETVKLREANRELLETNEALQASLALLRSQEARASSQWDELKQELSAARRREAAVRQERGRMRQQLLRLRQELGVLQAARGRSGKVRPRAALQRHTPLVQAGSRKNPSKDGWEDVSGDSDTEEEYSDSLDSPRPERQAGTRSRTPRPQWGQLQRKRGKRAVPPTSSMPREGADECQADARTHTWGGPEVAQPMGRMRRMTRGGVRGLALRRRILSLQQQ